MPDTRSLGDIIADEIRPRSPLEELRWLRAERKRLIEENHELLQLALPALLKRKRGRPPKPTKPKGKPGRPVKWDFSGIDVIADMESQKALYRTAKRLDPQSHVTDKELAEWMVDDIRKNAGAPISRNLTKTISNMLRGTFSKARVAAGQQLRKPRR